MMTRRELLAGLILTAACKGEMMKPDDPKDEIPNKADVPIVRAQGTGRFVPPPTKKDGE
jgi:hypothetical protein